MTSDTTTDEDPQSISFENAESNVVIRVRATKRDILESREDDPRKTASEETRFETEGYLVFDRHLKNSLINLDAYLAPPGDHLYGRPTEIEMDDFVIHTGYCDVEYDFNLYWDELRQAAKVRAHEDRSHETRILASWLWLSNRDHIDAAEARSIFRALKHAVEEADDAPEWGICHDGDPTYWHHRDTLPATTIEEARLYVDGGYDAVKEARDDE